VLPLPLLYHDAIAAFYHLTVHFIIIIIIISLQTLSSMERSTRPLPSTYQTRNLLPQATPPGRRLNEKKSYSDRHTKWACDVLPQWIPAGP
jgi:hypothetical protein